MPRHDADQVIAALSGQADRVLARFDVVAVKRGLFWRSAACPACGQRTRRDALSVHATTGLWTCFVCQARGNVLQLVAGYAGLDCRREFTTVLELALEIAGQLAPHVSIHSPPRPSQAARASSEAAEEAQRAQDARVATERCWSALWTHSRAGEAYLRSRGLRRTIDVRFDARGAVCTRLWSFAGHAVNVVRRRIVEDDRPKILGLAGCPTLGTFVGRMTTSLDRDVLISEGLFDSLTGNQLWPDLLVLGAHGAGRLPAIAAAVAPLVLAAGKRLWIAPHGDDTGRLFAARAMSAATEAGLELGTTLRVLDLRGANDLNDAALERLRRDELRDSAATKILASGELVG